MTTDVLINTRNVHGQTLAEDLIWGAKPIAAEIGRSERQTFYLLENGQLPAQRIGGRWVASRSALRRHFGGAV
jgi:hypothetical protein